MGRMVTVRGQHVCNGQASLIWGFPILPILSSYGEKIIKYGLNMVFH